VVVNKLIFILVFVGFIQGCASMVAPRGLSATNCAPALEMPSGTRYIQCVEDPKVVELPTHEELRQLPPAEKMPVVAVYSFLDLTGQRKSAGGVAMFSTAITQGASTMLIDALKTAGNGKWFRVVERVGIDHLTRERQIVRTTRQQYDEEDDTGLAPLLFAGIILEGGVIGFDTNIETGGRGARYLGIGMSQAYRRDIVTVHLRAVSTLTGEILLNVQTSKTILSIANGFDVFKFIDMDTQLVEIEDGMTENESVTRSLRSCIEAAVLELIYQGEEHEFWKVNRPEDEEIILEIPVPTEEIRG
jgi:curli production assembly/transport component CsgG